MKTAGGKVGQVAVWILLVMLVIGLAGFGITGFGGSLRTIGSVGEAKIDARDYARALRQELDAVSAQIGRPVGMAEAEIFGVDRTVLQQLVATAALDEEARRIGISAGDGQLVAAIRQMPAFSGLSGGFDRDTYRFTLERNNLSEAQFETRLRADLARGLLQSAVAGGVLPPEALVQVFAAYLAEERGFSLLRLTAADLQAPPPTRDEAGLRAFHAENPALFTRPEARVLRHALLTPESLVDQVTLDEAILRAAYADRRDEYVQPERRLVERLVFSDQAAADAARGLLDAGGAAFDDLVAARGLTLADIDLGDVAPEDLGAAAPAVFAAQVPGIAGPAPTPLGPALFRINASFAAQEVTFDQARPDLQAELALDAARRMIADRIEAINDAMAGGAEMTDLAAEQGMVLGQTELTAFSNEGLAAYPAFRQSALALAEGDFPDLVELEDGAVAVIELVTILAPELQPYEAVADAVAQAAEAADLARALAARRDAILAEIDAGAALGQFGIVTVIPRIARGGFVEGAPDGLVQRVFSLAQGQAAAVDAPDFTGIVRVDAVNAADPADPELAMLRQALSARLAQDLAQDLFALFSAHVQTLAEVRLDTAAIQAVNAQMR